MGIVCSKHVFHSTVSTCFNDVQITRYIEICQKTRWTPWIWSNYSDLTRPPPKWRFSPGNPLISGKSGLVKYYNLTRWMRQFLLTYPISTFSSLPWGLSFGEYLGVEGVEIGKYITPHLIAIERPLKKSHGFRKLSHIRHIPCTNVQTFLGGFKVGWMKWIYVEALELNLMLFFFTVPFSFDVLTQQIWCFARWSKKGGTYEKAKKVHHR